MKTERYIPQGMTYIEREELKSFATSCGLRGDIQSLTRTLIMIAHWMRQGKPVSFTEYASQWTEAGIFPGFFVPVKSPQTEVLRALFFR